MRPIGETIGHIDYSKKRSFKTIVYSRALKKEDADQIINSVSDLIDDSNYRPFYFRKLYELGLERFQEIEKLARSGDYPSRLFASMLKNNSGIQ